jgi:hypothetical protein
MSPNLAHIIGEPLTQVSEFKLPVSSMFRQGVSCFETVSGRDAAVELTRSYIQRVSKHGTHCLLTEFELNSET